MTPVRIQNYIFLFSLFNLISTQTGSIIKIKEELKIGSEIVELSQYLENKFTNYIETIQIINDDSILGCLAVDAKTGKVSVKCRIDREQICKIRTLKCIIELKFVITPNNKVISVKVEVIDINDNIPFWPNYKSIDLEMLEFDGNKMENNVRIYLSKADDSDVGINREIRYELKESDGVTNSKTFKIQSGLNSSSSLLGIGPVKLIDRELVNSYNLVLLAIDKGQPSLTGSLKLKIIIQDRNDNSPEFDKKKYTNYALSESSPIGSEVLKVSVTDKDDGINGQISYELFDSDATQYFEVKNDGRILVKHKLDYDNGKREFNFPLKAMDNALSFYRKTGVTEIEIKLKDENDEKPKITTHISQKDPVTSNPAIKENMKQSEVVLAHLLIEDDDFDKNDRVLCLLDNSPPKIRLDKISNNAYQIVAFRQFDREVEQSVLVEVICQDQAGNKEKKSIKFIILDDNDNAPYFRRMYHFQVFENASSPNIKIGEISAIDRDAGDNGKITYQIIGIENETFEIKSDGKVFTKHVLDREQIDHYNLTILAKDHGVPSLTGTVTMIIDVIDVNDWPPTFTKSVYTFYIPETLKIGSLVGRVHATDQDKDGGDSIRYRLIPQFYSPENRVNPFQIYNSRKGEIRTRYLLDREKTNVYLLKVVAVDRSIRNPSGDSRYEVHSSTSQIKVIITDYNDNPPIFSISNYTNFPINIRTDIGEEVGIITATDNDEGDNAKITYRLIRSTGYKLFNLNPNDGRIRLAAILKKPAEYTLTIQACDHGTNQLCSQYLMIIIKVMPNDNVFVPPSRTSDFNVYILFTVVLIVVIVFLVFGCFFIFKSKYCKHFLQRVDTSSSSGIKPNSNVNYQNEQLTSDQANNQLLPSDLKNLNIPTRQRQISAEYQIIADSSPSYQMNYNYPLPHSPQQGHFALNFGDQLPPQPEEPRYYQHQLPLYFTPHHVYQCIPSPHNTNPLPSRRVHSPMNRHRQYQNNNNNLDFNNPNNILREDGDQTIHEISMATIGHNGNRPNYHYSTQHRRSNSLMDFSTQPFNSDAQEFYYPPTQSPVPSPPLMTSNYQMNYQSLQKPKPKASYV